MSDRDWLPALHALRDPFGPWGRLIGMVPVAASARELVTTWSVTPQMMQPFGIVNGGVHCSVTETLASLAACLYLADQRLSDDAPLPDLADLAQWPPVAGVSNQTEFFRPVRDGTLTSAATPVHCGRTQQLWLVTTLDAQDRLVARGQLRVHNL